MTELTFAKSFLSTLDSRPLKLQPDYVQSPKNVSINGPYTLPKMPHPFRKPTTSSSTTSSNQIPSQAQSSANLTVTLKSTRNPVLHLTLPATDPGTTILELKGKVAETLKLHDGTERVRVLHRKKPVGDVKTIKELLAAASDTSTTGGGEIETGEGQQQEIEFGVMVLGYNKEVEEGGADTTMKDAEGAGTTTAPGVLSGEEVLAGEEFWGDLKGFLMQRIRDEGKAGEVFERFKGSWEKR